METPGSEPLIPSASTLRKGSPVTRISPWSPVPFFALSWLCAAQSTTRVSVRSDGIQAAGHSATSALSGDGRLVAFASLAHDLVGGDSNGVQDVFVHDTWTGNTELVSVSMAGAQADADCLGPVLSEDGRFVAYRSDATNLVPGDLNGLSDVFVHDRLLGTTVRASVDLSGGDPDARSYYQTLSHDGRFVAFQSEASDLVSGDVNATFDVFVRDMQSGTTEIASVGPGGEQSGALEFSVEPAISSDGSCVVFASITENFAPGLANGVLDVFLRDRFQATTEIVSIGLSGAPANGPSWLPAVSADGRFVAFVSDATNLVPGDTNGVTDVFVRDRLLGKTERASIASDGSQGSLSSYLYYSHPTLSGDGRYVVFESYAPELVPGDANGWADVFLHDRRLSATTLVSVTSAGKQVHLASTRGTISADGASIAFECDDGHLVPGDTNGMYDVFVRRPASTCAPIEAYCASKTNSLGCVPSIGASGLPSLAGPEAFFVTATAVRSHALGILLLGTAADWKPFAGGALCVAGKIWRSPPQSSGGSSGAIDCSGSYSFHLSQAHLLGLAVAAGTPLFGQWISRDPGFAPPDAIGLSDAIEFTPCP